MDKSERNKVSDTPRNERNKMLSEHKLAAINAAIGATFAAVVIVSIVVCIAYTETHKPKMEEKR